MFIRIFALSVIFGATSLFAAPSGGRVTAGDAELSNPLNIIQHSEHLGTSWESFDIAADEVVNITQPSASALISIKVRNGVETNIDGTLNANGRVALENPAGVLFGAGSVVNVGGLLTSASAGAVRANGVINAPLGEVHLQSLSNNNVVNVGGVIEAQRIIVEGANEVTLGASARLTASKEVLVGGGFQGNGTIANSQKTIVESGSLIISPRVIIWSDVSTNFQGSINAEGGFVEVSGKKSLASFDIAKIKAAELLLDPAAITIGTATTDDTEISTAGDGAVLADDGEDDEAFVISAAAIQNFAGAVSLAASSAITVSEPINKSNGGLTLAAPLIAVFNSIAITGTDNDLTITAGGGIIFTQVRVITLSGKNISLTSPSAGAASNKNLTITATSRVNFAGHIDLGTGNLAITGLLMDIKAAESGVTIASPWTIKADDISIILTHTNPDTEFAGLRATADLKLEAKNDIILSVRYINFNGDSTKGGTPNDLTLIAGNEIKFTREDETSLIVTNLTIGGTVIAESTDGTTATKRKLTLEATGQLNFATDKATTISGGSIILSSTMAGADSDQELTVTSTGAIILSGAINTGAGNMDFTSGASHRINFSTARATTLTGGDISLASTGGTPTVSNKDITITAAGTITLGGAFNSGSGDMVITSGADSSGANQPINFSTTLATTLTSAGDITLTSAGGALTASNQAVTITATGNLTLSGNFDAGTGNVAITYGSGIPSADSFLTDDITYTFTGSGAIAYPTWLTGAGRNVTLIAETANIFGFSDIDLSEGGDDSSRRGNLTVRALIVSAIDAKVSSIIANDITITGLSPKLGQEAGFQGTEDATLDASGNITIRSAHIVFSGSGVLKNLTLKAGGEILFPQDTNIAVNNLTLSGTIKAESSSGGTPTQEDLTITTAATGEIIFASDKATTITGANINLASSNAQTTASDKDLTITATNTLTMSGNYNIGMGDASFSFAGTGAQNPAPASLSTNDLTLTYTAAGNSTGDGLSDNFLKYNAAWMDGKGRNLTLKAASATIRNLTNVNLGDDDNPNAKRGSLSLSAIVILVPNADNSGDPYVIKAHDITISPSSTSGTEAAAAFRSGGSMVLDATNDIRFAARYIHFNIIGASDDLTLIAGSGNIFFPQVTNIIARNITFGGTLGVGTTPGANSITITASGKLNFATDKATTINAYGITLLSTSVGDASNNNLTLTAQGGISFQGNFDIGTGRLLALAGRGASGAVAFVETSSTKPTIKASSVLLEQDSAVFALGNLAAAPAAFNLPLGVKPRVRYTGGGTQPTPTEDDNWFNLASANPTFDAGTDDDITIADLLAQGSQLGGGDFAGIEVDENGLLDFGGETIILITEGDIIFPAEVREIRAGNLTLTAASIMTAGSSNFAAALKIDVSNTLNLSVGTLATTGALVLEGAILIIASDTAITAPTITITMTDTGAGADAAIRNVANESLSLTATAGDIRLKAAKLNLRHANSSAGEGDLTLLASGDIVFAGAIQAEANNITLSGLVRAEIVNANNAITRYNLSLEAREKITFAAGKDTTIRGNTITLTSPMVQTTASGQDLTLITATSGTLTLEGKFNVGSGDLTATAAVINVGAGNASISAANISLTATRDAGSQAAVPANAGLLGLGNMTLTATSKITIEVAYINFNAEGGDDNLTLIAPEILFRGDSGVNITATDITIGGVVKVVDNSTVALLPLELTASGKLTFAGDKPTTITASLLTLTSTTKGEPSGQALTIAATENLTLGGSFDVGDGTMDITAGAGSATGTIIFTNATLKASAISLTQDGAFFVETKPATFTIPTDDAETGGKPSVTYRGGGIQPSHDWFTLPARIIFDTENTDDINIADLIDDDSTLANGDFVSFSINAQGELDFGSENIVLITEGNIIFPEGIRIIKAESLTLSAASIVTNHSSGNFTADLKIDVVGTLILSSLTSTGALTLEGATLAIPNALTLTATAITITMVEAEDTPIRNAGSQLLSLTATQGDITLAASTLSLSSGDLTLTTATDENGVSGEILFPQNTFVFANNIALGGVVKAESGTSPLTQHNLEIRAFEQITFADDKPTTISGNNINIFSFVKGETSGQNLTLTATGTLRLNGDFDIGEGAAVLNYAAGEVPEPNSFIARDITVRFTAPAVPGSLVDVLYEPWMAGATNSLSIFAGGHKLAIGGSGLTGLDVIFEAATIATRFGITVNAKNITIRGVNARIVLGGGGLTLNATENIRFNIVSVDNSQGFGFDLSAGGDIIFERAATISAPLLSITADLIKAESMAEDGTITQHNLTLKAGTSITFHRASPIMADNLFIGTPLVTGSNINLSAVTGDTIFTQNTRIASPTSLTLGGVIKAQSTAQDGTITRRNLRLESAALTFSTTRATTISAKEFLFDGGAGGAGAASGQDLTINTSLDLDIQGDINVGDGRINLNAGTDSSVGAITLLALGGNALPTLTARRIRLTHNEGPFGGPAPANFIIPSGGKPQVQYTGTTQTQPEPSSSDWFELARLSFTATGQENINLMDLLDTDIDFSEFSIDEDGLLDLGNQTVELTTEGNIIFPANLTEIRAVALTIVAANIGTGTDGTGDLADLKISVTAKLTLPAIALTSSGTLTLEAGTISIGSGSNFSLTANDIGITARTASAQAFTSASAAVAFNATNNLTFSVSNMRIGTGEAAFDLTLSAGKQILFTRSFSANAKVITLDSPTIKAESTAQDGTTTQHDLSFVADFSGTAKINFSTDEATTISGNDLTFNSNAKSDATNQDLTITAAGTLTFGNGVDAGTNATTPTTLTLEGNNIDIGVDSTFKADNIIVTTNEHALISTADVTFEATNNITFNTSTLDFGGDNPGDLTITAGGQVLFTESVSIITARTTFNSGTIKAQTAGDTPMGVGISISAMLTFSSTEATTMSGLNISLRFATTGTTGGQDLTLNASGNITLEGTLNAGDGTLRFTAGSGAGSGTIIFNDTPTLAAAAIFLTQDGDVFPTAAPAVTFTIPSSGKPTINYTGAQTQEDVTWAKQTGIFSDEDVNLAEELEKAGGDLEGKDSDDSNNIMIDLTEEEEEEDKNFVINSDESLILPNVDVMIMAKVITIRAKSIRNDVEDSTGITKPLMLIATDTVIIDANISSTANIIIKAPEVVFSGSKPVRLSGTNIMIQLPDDMDMPNAMPLANNQNVELVATSGDIMLNNNVNVGFGTLKLEASGRIMTSNADAMIMGNRVVLDAGTKSSIGGALTIISMNDIRLLGNIETEGNIVLRAGGSIITPEDATTIEATGADKDITFEQKYALRQSHDLTLKATGDITIIGRLNRGAADITLDSGGELDVTEASLIAGGITCLPARLEASAPICQ